MGKRVCVTGICGFIGSHLADELLAHGYEVCGIDSLDEQVHGFNARRPAYLHPAVQFLQGDVCETTVERLLPVDYVVHLAAKVGVGQSAYQLSDYVWNNSFGTATLLECLQGRNKPAKLVVASSMSVYGEGQYQRLRGDLNMDEPVATDESHRPSLASTYALTKYDQERLCLLWGQAFHVPTIALRFFNVYGPRQSLSNPYTGALAIFASRLLNHQPPVIFEDGQQRRDFVYVTDIARGIRLALESDLSNEVLNLGNGRSVTILELAERLAHALNSDIQPLITNQHRVGDIRHCFADISKARRLLGYEPQVDLDEGIQRTVAWLRTQTAIDKFAEHKVELEQLGLLS